METEESTVFHSPSYQYIFANTENRYVERFVVWLQHSLASWPTLAEPLIAPCLHDTACWKVAAAYKRSSLV